MKSCRATTRQNTQCSNRVLPFSRYCLVHQDPTSWLAGTIIGILFTLVIAIWQIREPNIDVRCYLDQSGDPSKMMCILTNSGRAEARDIYVSFNRDFPVETKLYSSPESAIEIQEVDSPPNPEQFLEYAKATTAFLIRVPMVAAGDEIEFTLATTNNDNLRAAKQVLLIRNHIVGVLLEFYRRLALIHPNEVKGVLVQDIISERIKTENFFSPDKYSYEKGRFQVNYYDEKEIKAASKNQDIYSKYKKEFKDVFENKPQYKAPVLRLRTPKGEVTWAIMSPYVRTYAGYIVSPLELKQKGQLIVSPSIPKSYD